jgi:hypothetical protein
MTQRILVFAPLLLGLTACGEDCPADDTAPDTTDTHDTGPVDTNDSQADTDGGDVDADGDGWSWPEDCNDADPDISPDALDVADGVDNNCDGIIDMHTLAAAHTKLIGEAAGDMAAAHLGGVGDVNGDGFDDISVGAWFNDAAFRDAGAAYIVFGPVPAGAFSLSYADIRISGEAAEDNLGRTVSAGDINGDGYGDVFTSSMGEDSGGRNAGAVYLLHGPLEGPWNLADAQAKIVGEAEGDNLLRAIVAGDLDSDGTDDYLLGSPGEATYGSHTGAAYVWLGAPSGSVDLADAHAKLHGIAPGDMAGAFLVGPGDLNGDGHDDVIIGDDKGSHGGDLRGSAYVIHGPITAQTSRLTAASGAMFFGPRDNAQAGKVAWAGDLTGDGSDDWLTAAFGDGGGLAWVFDGGLEGELNGNDAAAIGDIGLDDATGVGDVNGDGQDDLLIGHRGESFLFFGPLGGAFGQRHVDVHFPAEEDDDDAGWRVSPAGDTNADGLADFLIGARSEDTAGSGAGAAYLILGSR